MCTKTRSGFTAPQSSMVDFTIEVTHTNFPAYVHYLHMRLLVCYIDFGHSISKSGGELMVRS